MEIVKIKLKRPILVQILDVLKEVLLKGITEARAIVNLYSTIVEHILDDTGEIEFTLTEAQMLYYVLVRMNSLSKELLELRNKLKKLEWR